MGIWGERKPVRRALDESLNRLGLNPIVEILIQPQSRSAHGASDVVVTIDIPFTSFPGVLGLQGNRWLICPTCVPKHTPNHSWFSAKMTIEEKIYQTSHSRFVSIFFSSMSDFTNNPSPQFEKFVGGRR
jgi:hypothetical protein